MAESETGSNDAAGSVSRNNSDNDSLDVFVQEALPEFSRIHIGVGGNIGAGKTEFIEQAFKEPNRTILLSVLSPGFKQLSADLKRDYINIIEETLDKNVLTAYYQDSKKYSFMAQVYFFKSRVYNQAKIEAARGVIFEDRTLLEDMAVFGKTQHDMGFMTDTEWKVYSEDIYPMFSKRIVKPHLWVYLPVETDVLMERIKRRGREFEQKIPREYIQCLNDNYAALARNYTAPKLIIPFNEDREARGVEFYTEKFTAMAEIVQQLRAGWVYNHGEGLKINPELIKKAA